MKRVKVVDALVSTDYGKNITVMGWVRSHRSSKAVDFIALNDGSTIKNIQVVVSPEVMDAEQLKTYTTGACNRATGKLVESQGAGQSVEVQAQEIEIYGLCPSDYPMQKKGQALNICVSMPICVCVQILLVRSSVYATTWLLLYTDTFMSMDSITSIRQL